LPPGNGRRVRMRQIADTQQAIRENVARFNEQLKQIRAQIAATP
jgi:hypothetical protein